MPYVATYAEQAPLREEIEARSGLALLEFGANWCGHCQGAQPAIAAAHHRVHQRAPPSS